MQKWVMFLLLSHKHKYTSITAASFCTYFFLTLLKWNRLRVPTWPKGWHPCASGEQARTCVSGLTCTPGAVFIQLRQQLEIYSLEDARRQTGSEKELLSYWVGAGGEGPNEQKPLSLRVYLGERLSWLTMPRAISPSWKGIGGNIPVPFVYRFTLDRVLILPLLGRKRDQCWLSHCHLYSEHRFSNCLHNGLCLPVCRCPTQANKPIKHGGKIPWSLSNCRHQLLLPACQLFLFCKNCHLYSLRKSKYQCHPGIMEGTRFLSGVSSVETVNGNFTIHWVQSGYVGSSSICSDF